MKPSKQFPTIQTPHLHRTFLEHVKRTIQAKPPKTTYFSLILVA